MRIIDGERSKPYSPFSRNENSETCFRCVICGGEILSKNNVESEKDVIIVCPHCQGYIYQGGALTEDQVDKLLGHGGNG